MSNTQQTPAQAQDNQQATQLTQTITFTDAKNVALGTVISTLNAVNNTARIVEHTTGILADKAERYRAQVAIADAITHNDIMALYEKQAKDLGLDIK